MNEDGQFLYASDTDYCCHINKVEPLNTSIQDYDIWIAGLRRDQTKFRSGLDYFEKQKSGITKYHPILDWNSKMIYEYRKLHNLPAHPLEEKGFFSIGCFLARKVCTTKTSVADAGLGAIKLNVAFI